MISKFRILENLAVVLFLVNVLACSESIKSDTVTSTTVDNNPLVVAISFNTEMSTDAHLEYWLSGSDERNLSTVFPDRKNHKIVLVGLTGDSEYNYRIHLTNEETESTSEAYSFMTGSLPDHLPTFELVVDNEDVFGGFIMLRKKNTPGAQMILNHRGEIVWYQLSDSSVFRPFSVTSNNTYVALKDEDEIVEMNYYGDTVLHLLQNENGFDKKLHHEILKDEKNQFIALTKEEKVFDLRAYGGGKEITVVGDGILILDSLGNKVWSWNMFDVMDIGPSKKMYQTRGDWSHANAVSKDSDGNFLVSFRNFNQIWKIDATDGHIIWRLGDNGDFELAESDYFRVQHAVHVNPNGNIMLFDNIVEVQKTSRAIAFRIDDTNRIAEKTLDVYLPDSLYSFKQGNVNFIDDNKLLFCSSMSKKIAITDLEGNILWQINSDQSFYRAEYIPKFQN